MSYLLETLGRGLLGRLLSAFESHLGIPQDDDIDALLEQRQDAATSFDLAVRLGAAYLREDRLSEALAAFEHSRSLDGPHYLADIGLACVYSELGRTGAALDHLQTALKASPHDSAISFSIGSCLEQQDRPDEAVRFYERSLDLCPELRNAHERIAAIAVRRGDWDGARDRYERLADLEPGDVDTLMPLANLHLQCGNVEDSIELFQRALLVEPDTADEAAEFDNLIENDGGLRETIASVAELVEKYPGVTEFRVQLADLYVKADDDQRAVEEYRAALDLHPTFLEATVKLGTQHLRRRRYDAAAREYARAVELNDRLLTAFVGLGVAQDTAGRESESQATFDLAVSLTPNSTLLFSESNQLHLKSARRADGGGVALCDESFDDVSRDRLLGDTIRRHQRVLIGSPNRADVHYRLGMLLRQCEDCEAAAVEFRRAVDLNPTCVKAAIKLGVTLREIGRLDDALAAFRTALRVDQRQIETHYQLALLFSQYNRFQTVLDRYEVELGRESDATDFRQNLSLTLQNIGMLDRADAAWRSTCELTDGANLLLGENRISADHDN